MFNIIAVVLGAGAIIVYYKGVRNAAAWGTPFMALLVAGAVAAVILPHMQLGEMLQDRGVGAAYRPYEGVGRLLGDDLSQGDHVLVIVDHMAIDTLDEDPAVHAEKVAEAISNGAGVSLSLLDIATVQDERASAFDSAIEQYRDDGVRLIFSQTFAGLPASDSVDLVYDLERLSCFDWADPPLFAACVDDLYNPAGLEQYIQEGLLSAVALQPADGEPGIAIGSENVDEMPSAAPAGPYSR